MVYQQQLRAMVVGASGRMGCQLIKGVVDAGLSLSAAIVLPKNAAIGRDAGVVAGLKEIGCQISDDALTGALNSDIIFDFTTPQSSCYFAELAAQVRIAHVIGTTGFSVAQEQKIQAAARHTVIVKSSNMSFAINLLVELVKKAAGVLDNSFDIEIVEMHHRHKTDAPSGTALMLGEAAAKGRAIDLDTNNKVTCREGYTGPRVPGSIGFQSLRGGNVVGEHKVVMAGDGERLVLGHCADDREVFARGAIKAGLWAHGRKAGLYSMRDVLGFGLNSID